MNASEPNCQYWRGALCGLLVTGNRFLCTQPETCATIDASALGALPAARWVSVRGNAFEDDRAALCSSRRRCVGAADCADLFSSGAACDAYHDSLSSSTV